MTAFKIEVNLYPAFSWDSQAQQYAEQGTPGIRLESHWIEAGGGERFPDQELGGARYLDSLPDVARVDCLLYRGADGTLSGILNRYDGKNPLEKLDAINLWVRPERQRWGIATALLRAAKRRWPGITVEKQRYTQDGVKLLAALIQRGEVALPTGDIPLT